MNSSQLLYKILNLQHSINRKQAEYNLALKTNNVQGIRLNKEALTDLQTNLDELMTAFNAVPPAPETLPVKPKKTSWWLRIFHIK